MDSIIDFIFSNSSKLLSSECFRCRTITNAKELTAGKLGKISISACRLPAEPPIISTLQFAVTLFFAIIFLSALVCISLEQWSIL